jgi:hypothetical protein
MHLPLVSKRHFFHFYPFLTIFIFANSHNGVMNFTVNNLEQFLTLKAAYSIENQYRKNRRAKTLQTNCTINYYLTFLFREQFRKFFANNRQFILCMVRIFYCVIESSPEKVNVTTAVLNEK